LRDAAAAEKRAKRLAEAAAAVEELKARRRALGNIQYIGQLYRFGMLTENIMHRLVLYYCQGSAARLHGV
jgi:translation initiation factor 4G